MCFSSVSIDQPGGLIANAIAGTWLGGCLDIDSAEVMMLIGTNPPVSMQGPVPMKRRYNDAVKRGMTLIVVDPRKTEIAREANIFVQPRPAQDVPIVAGVINRIFAMGKEDKEFLATHATGVKELKQAVAPFTPEVVAERAGIPADQIIQLADIFASKRGIVDCGTGPNMSGYGVLLEYLCHALTTITGAWRREGERAPNRAVLTNQAMPRAQAADPIAGWGFGEKLRVKNFTCTAAGLQTAALPDEILMEGEGQVRAMIVVGGNPALAWPDQIKTKAALEKLELLIIIDPEMNMTARYAHYVIAPKIAFEIPADSMVKEVLMILCSDRGYPQKPYGHISKPIVDPPPGSDVIEDWEFFHGLASRMGIEIPLASRSFVYEAGRVPTLATGTSHEFVLNKTYKPTSVELHKKLLAGSAVPYEELERYPDGHVFDRVAGTVLPADPATAGRLSIGNEVMMGQLTELASKPQSVDSRFPLRLISRRMPDRYNSAWSRYDGVNKEKFRYNAAFMNPEDLESFGLKSGQVVEITSNRASIKGIVEAASDVRRGVVSMSHCWGGMPGDEEDPGVDGGNTGRLCDAEVYEPLAGIPLMSAIPINVKGL